MSYQAYKVLHLLGVVFLFMSLGGMALLGMSGSFKRSVVGRRLAVVSHGVALAIILVAGFGLLARLGLMAGGIPGWAWLKLGIWLLMGASVVALKRSAGLARVLWFVLPLLGALAAWLAVAKPVL